ncbi:MAG: hypothetical protein WD335_02405 [Candidatus Paceibacterota bacterium]
MQNKVLDRVIKKLYFSSTLQQELRDDAAAVKKRYGLTDTELQAVQSGDARQLVNLGMDPRLVQDATPTLMDKVRLLSRRIGVAVVAGVMGMFMLMPGARASARAVPRLGRRVSPRYVLGRVRARISARAGKVQGRYARRALRRVRARMLKPGDTPELDAQLQSTKGVSLQDPIQ